MAVDMDVERGRLPEIRPYSPPSSLASRSATPWHHIPDYIPLRHKHRDQSSEKSIQKSRPHSKIGTTGSTQRYKQYIQAVAQHTPHLQRIYTLLANQDEHVTSHSAEKTRTQSECTGSLLVADWSSNSTTLSVRTDPYGKHVWDIAEALSTASIQDTPRDIVVIPHGIQSTSLVHLGAALSIEPQSFEQHIDRENFVDSGDIHTLSFDFPEMYWDERKTQPKSPMSLFEVDVNGVAPQVVRACHNIYTVMHRLTWMQVTSPRSASTIHIILIDGSTEAKSQSTHRLTQKPISFSEYCAFGSMGDCLLMHNSSSSFHTCFTGALVNQTLEAGQDTASRRSVVQDFITRTILDQVANKWEDFTFEVQQHMLNPAPTPARNERDETEEVLKRREDFEKMHRILSSQLAKLRRRTQSDEGLLSERRLVDVQAVLADWIVQLEKSLQSLLGKIAIAESAKTSAQAVRGRNLQVLAFLFIPVGTVTSFYGMNTREILADPPANWTFAVGAATSVAVAALFILIWHFYMVWYRRRSAR